MARQGASYSYAEPPAAQAGHLRQDWLEVRMNEWLWLGCSWMWGGLNVVWSQSVRYSLDLLKIWYVWELHLFTVSFFIIFIINFNGWFDDFELSLIICLSEIEDGGGVQCWQKCSVLVEVWCWKEVSLGDKMSVSRWELKVGWFFLLVRRLINIIYFSFIIYSYIYL